MSSCSELEKNIFLTKSIELLSKMSQTMIDTMDIEKILMEINYAVKKLIGAEGAGFLLFDQENNQLILQKPAFGINDKELISKYQVSLLEGGNAVNVFRNRKPYFSNDIEHDPIIKKNLTNIFLTKNVVTVPVGVGNNYFGVLHIQNKPGGFTQDDVNLINLFVAQIAVVIQNTRLLAQSHFQEAQINKLLQKAKKRCEQLESVLTFTQGLTVKLLEGKGLNGITKEIGKYLKKPVVFFDRLDWKRYMYNVDKDITESLDDLDDFLQKKENIRKYSVIPISQKYFKYHNKNGIDESVIISAVRLDRVSLGFIIIFAKNSINQYEKLIIENAGYLYAIELMKQKENFEIEQNIRKDFLEMLLDEDSFNEEEIKRKATYIGHDLTAHHFISIIEPDNFPLMFENQKTHEHSKYHLKREFMRLVNDTIQKNNFEGITILQGSKVVLLIKCKKRNLFDLIVERLSSLLKDATNEYFNSDITIAIGSVVDEIKNIKRSYQEADDVFNFLRNTKKYGKCMSYKELGFYQLLLNKKFGESSEEFAKYILQPLIKSDFEKGTTYLPTLQRYLYNNCHLQATANDLYVHPNTLRYRLERIKDISEFDFQLEEDRLNLHLAIKVLSYKMPGLFDRGVKTNNTSHEKEI